MGTYHKTMGRSLGIDVWPAWFAWAINSPLRRWLHKPEEIFTRLHEVPSAAALFAEMHEALNANGKLLLVEPRLHIGRRDFEKQVAAAVEAKLKLVARPSVRLSHAALLAKASPITRAGS